MKSRAQLARQLSVNLLLATVACLVAGTQTARCESPSVAIYTMKADGSDWHRMAEFPEFAGIGSPAVSPDGTKIAFDSWQTSFSADGMVTVYDLQTETTKQLLRGLMPTWSADGESFAFSYRGVQTCRNDGTNVKTFDRSGWGAQWSPDGALIAYTRRGRVFLYDTKSQTSRDLIGADEESPYQRVYWNMTWSPDSQWICFLGHREDELRDLATINVQTGDIRIHDSNKWIFSDAAWHPDGNRIVFPKPDPDLKRHQLFEFDPNSDASPRRIEGQDPNRINTGLCWTPNGKALIVVSKPDDK